MELVEGGSAQANFIVQQQGVIEGVVFVDRDGDELLGPGESGLAGVSVTLSPAVRPRPTPQATSVFRGRVW